MKKYYLFLIIMMFFIGCNTYNKLSKEEKEEYSLKTIDFNNHRSQTDTALYSITYSELKKLIKTSKNKYQLVITYTRTCPDRRTTMEAFKKYLNKIRNTEIFIITPSDQIFKHKYENYLMDYPIKKYMLNSEVYSQSTIDVYNNSYEAEKKFLNQLCSNCNFGAATLAILFQGIDNVVFYNDKNYAKEHLNEKVDKKEAYKIVTEEIFKDITSHTN